jgi:hypothetical protein
MYKKAAEDDFVTVDVLKVAGEDNLRISQLLNNMCETGECPKDYTEVTVTKLSFLTSSLANLSGILLLFLSCFDCSAPVCRGSSAFLGMRR